MGLKKVKTCWRNTWMVPKRKATSNVLSELVWKLAHRATIVNYFLLNYVKKITTKITTAPGLHNFTQLLQKGKEEKEILSRAKKKKKSMPHSFHRKNLYVPYSLDCFVFVLSRHFSKVFGTYGSTVIISAKHAISHLVEIEPLQESKKIHNRLKSFLKEHC